MSDAKKSFVLYTDYQENILLISREQRGDLLTLIMAYASDDALPIVDGMTQMAFSFIKSRMDKDAERYSEVIEKRREAGKQGGRPKANGSDDKAKKANGFSEKQSEAKKADIDLDSVNDNVKDKNKTYMPPSVGDVEEYCRQEGYDKVNPEVFVDFYKSKNWMIGKNKMKDWKASVRNWNRDQRQGITTKDKPKNKFHNLDEHDYDYDKMMWNAVRARQESEQAEDTGYCEDWRPEKAL